MGACKFSSTQSPGAMDCDFRVVLRQSLVALDASRPGVSVFYRPRLCENSPV